MQQIDLFGETLVQKHKISRLEKSLMNYYKNSFDLRLERLKTLKKIFPKGLLIAGDLEFIFTIEEAESCFISGNYLATLVLIQSFIEKVFNEYYQREGLNSVAKKGLEQMINYARKNKIMNTFLLDKVESIRLKRNAIIHSKTQEYPHSISNRMIKLGTFTQPYKLLEKDAIEAFQAMILLGRLDFLK